MVMFHTLSKTKQDPHMHYLVQLAYGHQQPAFSCQSFQHASHKSGVQVWFVHKAQWEFGMYSRLPSGFVNLCGAPSGYTQDPNLRELERATCQEAHESHEYTNRKNPHTAVCMCTYDLY